MNQVQNQVDVQTSENEANEGAKTQEQAEFTPPENINNQSEDTKNWQEIAENQRIRAEKAEARAKELAGKTEQQNATQQFDPSIIEKTLEQKLAERDLQAMEYPDEIKDEIKTLASVKGVDVREAAKNPYIQSLVEEHKRAERVKAASPDASGRATTSYTFDPSTPPDVDLTTTEGQAEMLKWEQQLERHHNSR